ncbi:MAG: class I SAM-dependent methyltransferase, partial [Negativicutes bacterium]|nr:class I SAM-dependent methyltransferase [Negativicutes bacterium]
EWLGKCCGYLKTILAGKFEGKTVIDYGFGRGNWSLAFRMAGASRVIAVDAAIDNVRRFASYCHDHRVDGIEVVNGDVLQEDIDEKAHFIWVYGVLPCVSDEEQFLRKLTSMLFDGNSYLYLYAYNEGSLRQLLVERCRDIYRNFCHNFAVDFLALNRRARIRARDDLISPRVKWHNALALEQLVRKCGLRVVDQQESFDEFLNQKANQEFSPYQICLERSQAHGRPISERRSPYGFDIEIIGKLMDLIDFSRGGEKMASAVTAGLMNTYYGTIGDGSCIKETIFELFLYVMNIFLSFPDLCRSSVLSRLAVELVEASKQGQGHKIKLPDQYAASYLFQRLQGESVRI